MISPFLYLSFAFVFTIVNRLYAKHILGNLDSYGVALLSNFLAGFIMLIFTFNKLPQILNFGLTESLLILLSGILWTYVAWAGNLSIAQNNFSFKEIIRQTRIIWVVLAGIFLLGEKLFWKDILGIVLIISSVYIISWKHISFKEHISSKPVLLAWSVSFFAAAIAVLEKTILSYDSVPVALYALILYFLPAIFMLPFLNKSKIEISKRLIKNNFKEIFIASCFMLVSYYTALTSYKLFPISIAYPLIQSSTVVGVLIGTFLFEANKDWEKKLFASCVAVLGVLIIKLL